MNRTLQNYLGAAALILFAILIEPWVGDEQRADRAAEELREQLAHASYPIRLNRTTEIVNAFLTPDNVRVTVLAVSGKAARDYSAQDLGRLRDVSRAAFCRTDVGMAEGFLPPARYDWKDAEGTPVASFKFDVEDCRQGG